ncbi:MULTISPECIES: GNAT family N-acetyltransferase [unclassified Acinetobacter]|uniref:GNAT family N-acetyltransferase n=1 Tax=unclassified Acinetobacter TaxID=196816 RepID=UPI0029347C32|nr:MULTISPECIES: GNAT family N-acetyltransferase [unclassified Acinetobacter]WOE31463.1 GNAT family N-acetyltransferase [Acinetobacter sp. SAAs470]WOE39659.1 GNAT family N-acetyltransferase [Acinetobacter sp. SAAs474]
MQIQFQRLTKICHQDIITLHTHPRVLQHMPLAKGVIFDQVQCLAWIQEKEQQWQQYGYGPWAFLVNGKFAGWGGLQYEQGDADLALVLHPQYWGLGRNIFHQIIKMAFMQMGLESVTILLPPTRTKLKAIGLLGFQFENETMIDGEKFLKYRLNRSFFSKK